MNSAKYLRSALYAHALFFVLQYLVSFLKPLCSEGKSVLIATSLCLWVEVLYWVLLELWEVGVLLAFWEAEESEDAPASSRGLASEIAQCEHSVLSVSKPWAHWHSSVWQIWSRKHPLGKGSPLFNRRQRRDSNVLSTRSSLSLGEHAVTADPQPPQLTPMFSSAGRLFKMIIP